MAALSKQKIELLPQDEWEKGSTGRLLRWTLNVGRYIVIVTELIVVLAFLSRFKLDRDLTNLYEEIKKKQVLVEANGQFEENFRFLQSRLKSIQQIEQQQTSTVAVIEEVSKLIPRDVSLSNLSFNGETISLTAVSLSEQGLASFLKNFKNSQRFEKTSLLGVTTGTEKGIGIQFQINSIFIPNNS
jgi:Tfp pilus assembly protein PilN